MANHLKTRLQDLVGTIAAKMNLLKTGLDSKANNTTTITGTGGLTGGGDLSANRTIAIDAATTTKINNGQSAFSQIGNKVDKVAGKGLSEQDYTLAEKNKLAGLESSKFKGLYATLAALKTALPEGAGSSAWNATNVGGFYADADASGSDVKRYIWDASDKKWVVQQSATDLTAAQVKGMYESNPDTNAFTDAFMSKLNSIAAGAEVNVQSDWSQANTSADDFIKNKPTIPTVGNGTVTVKDNGTTIGTFGLNDAANNTINLNEDYPDYQTMFTSALTF